MILRKLILLVTAVWLFPPAAHLPGQEQGARGRNKRIFVVPRPGPVVIDGKLDDWDLSGQIGVYMTRETSEMQSARIALMYDDQALYVSGVVRDPTPMVNRHDPLVEGDRAWNADAVQLRLCLDPKLGYPIPQSWPVKPSDKLVHLLLWYYTDRQEPNLQLAYGMNLRSAEGRIPQGGRAA